MKKLLLAFAFIFTFGGAFAVKASENQFKEISTPNLPTLEIEGIKLDDPSFKDNYEAVPIDEDFQDSGLPEWVFEAN